MKRVKVKDKEFEPFIPAEQIEKIVRELADRINEDFKGKNPLFLAILNGSFVFAADLLRKITIPCNISFVKFASYSGTETTEIVKELIGESINDLSADAGKMIFGLLRGGRLHLASTGLKVQSGDELVLADIQS